MSDACQYELTSEKKEEAVWLANGGADSIENTVALCLNCHKKMHVVNDPKDVDELKASNHK